MLLFGSFSCMCAVIIIIIMIIKFEMLEKMINSVF